MLQIHDDSVKEKQALELLVNDLKHDRDSLSAKLLISEQVKADKAFQIKDTEDMFKEEIDELKENLERKEYLLQFNE